MQSHCFTKFFSNLSLVDVDGSFDARLLLGLDLRDHHLEDAVLHLGADAVSVRILGEEKRCIELWW